MQPLRLCAFLALIAVIRCYELSKNQREFLCVMNGNYNDKEQVEKDGANRTAIDMKFQPIYAPALSGMPVVYIEESSGGVLLRANIAILTQEDGDTIYLQRNNFAGNPDIKPGTFDANRIKNFTLKDLQGPQDCRNAAVRVGAYIFSTDWQNCKQANDKGQRGEYAATDTCNEHTLTVPKGALEKSTVVAYKFKLQGPKYPVENDAGNYVCDC